MASTRLRRTFHYPADSDDDDDAVEEGMDEQDQETLITSLSTKDTSSTRLYTQTLLALPLLPLLLYIPLLFSLESLLPSLATILSLLGSAYTLYFVPLPPVRIRITDSSPSALSSNSSVRKGKTTYRDLYGLKSSPVSETPPVPYISEGVADLLRRYIVSANTAICVILAVHELWQEREWWEGMMVGGGYIPGLIHIIIMWARRELRVVDLGALERLRYRSKNT